MLPKHKYCNKKKKLSIERCFKYQNIVVNQRKGSLDAVFYAFKIYEDLLSPYYELVQHDNPYKDVSILEDNMDVHLKARKIVQHLIDKKNICFLDALVNSQDMYIIDKLHKDQKRLLQDVRFKTSSSDARAVAYAQSEMERVWYNDLVFNMLVVEKASIRYYKQLVLKAKSATPL